MKSGEGGGGCEKEEKKKKRVRTTTGGKDTYPVFFFPPGTVKYRRTDERKLRCAKYPGTSVIDDTHTLSSVAHKETHTGTANSQRIRASNSKGTSRTESWALLPKVRTLPWPIYLPMCIPTRLHGAGSSTSTRLWDQGKVRTYCAVCVSCLGTQPSSAPSNCSLPLRFVFFCSNVYLFRDVCLRSTQGRRHGTCTMGCKVGSRYRLLLRGPRVRGMVLVLHLLPHTTFGLY